MYIILLFIEYIIEVSVGSILRWYSAVEPLGKALITDESQPLAPAMASGEEL